jgi:Domain of unknown function (DUF1874)
MRLGVLNTSIITTDGQYSLETIALDRARVLVKESQIDSAVGHESTAEILSALLGVDVPVNRQPFSQQAGQSALVFKLNGRPPEGQILSREQLEEIGYTFKLLTRLS